MDERQYQVGDIVRSSVCVSEITSVDEGYVTLGKNYTVPINSIKPVEIGSGIDHRLILVSPYSLRARIVGLSQTVYHPQKCHYLDDMIDGRIAVADVVKQNSFTFVHELQDWLRNNAPKYSIKGT